MWLRNLILCLALVSVAQAETWRGGRPEEPVLAV